MPRYEFEYVDANKQKQIVERQYRINECPSWIQLEDGTNATLRISLTARMKSNWDSYEPSDLPL